MLVCLVVGLVGWLTDLVQNGSALSFASAGNLVGGVTLDRSYHAGARPRACGLGGGVGGTGGEESRAQTAVLTSPVPHRYSEEETRQKVRTFRQMLMEKEGMLTREDRPGGHM